MDNSINITIEEKQELVNQAKGRINAKVKIMYYIFAPLLIISLFMQAIKTGSYNFNLLIRSLPFLVVIAGIIYFCIVIIPIVKEIAPYLNELNNNFKEE